MEREPINLKQRLIRIGAGVVALVSGLGGIGVLEQASASSKGINPPSSTNPKATPTAEVPEIKLTPTPQPGKPRP